MADVWFVANDAGFVEVLQRQAVGAVLNGYAETIKAQADSMAKYGTYDTASAMVVGDRQMALVTTGNYPSRIDNAHRDTLLKAVG